MKYEREKYSNKLKSLKKTYLSENKKIAKIYSSKISLKYKA